MFTPIRTALLAAGLLALAAAPAQAGVTSIDDTVSGFLSTTSATSFQNLSASGTFTDDYTFHVNWNLLGSTVAIDLSGLTGFNAVSGLTISIYQGTPVTGGGSAGAVLVATSAGLPSAPGIAQISKQALSTSNNPYFLEVTGTSTGLSSYGGFITTVAAVPEPASAALMLAGMSLMAVVAVRRRG